LGKSDAPSGEPAPRPTALSRVKRWLREPLLYFLEDMSDLREPNREELEAWFAKNSQRFTVAGRASFRHLDFSFDKRGVQAREAAAQVIEKLAGQPPDSPDVVALAALRELPDSLIERRLIDAGGSGLAGKRIEFVGLQATIADVLVRVQMHDGRELTTLVRPSQAWVEIAVSRGLLAVAGAYFKVGIEHILFGVDHLLFILGLLFIVKDRWRLVKTISSFTVAHSITLAIATLGYARAPGPPLTAAIALSILFLGPEIVRAQRGETSLTIRHPWVIAFAFGLQHGFGFASGLSTMGLPRAEIPLALLLFNLGVEAGQILFVLAARATLLAFPMALLAGTLAGSRLPPFVFFHVANLVALVGLGGLLALGDRLNRIGPAAVGALALLTGSILGYRSGMDMAASKVAAQFIPGVAVTGFIVVALVVAWVPMAPSRSGRTRRTLAGAGFAVAGTVRLIQLLTVAALPTARGPRLPGQEDLLAMLRAGELSVPLVVGALLAVMVWGAGHALTPGHGKTIVAAYLIGSRSTPGHALYLGLKVTLTHTLGVFALGLVALFASQYMLPEQLYPWLGAVSGVIAVGLGAAMLWRRVRPLLARRGYDHHHGSHDHGHDHPHDHEHLHDHGYGHPHGHGPHHTHDHGHGHAHLPPGADGAPVTWRSLLGLGVWGGSSRAPRRSSCSSRPCPSTGRPWG
jgi:hypothetical protein